MKKYFLLSDYSHHGVNLWKDILKSIGLTNVNITTISQHGISNIPDCIIFDGGADINPFYYKETNDGLSKVHCYRDIFDTGLFHMFKNFPIPFVGICRGAQFLNVMLGGTLNQDIKPKHDYLHHVEVCDDTSLLDYLNKTHILVNSLHHQACDKLADNLVPTLVHSEYGTIEGFESAETIKVNNKTVPKYKAVQSHPEYIENKMVFGDTLLEYLFSL